MKEQSMTADLFDMQVKQVAELLSKAKVSEVAKLTGLSYTTVSVLKHGKREIKQLNVEMFSKLLECAINYPLQ